MTTAQPAVFDQRYMARALELARNGLYSTHPNPRVGCVVVQGAQIVGEGWHARAGEPHAEVYALRQAGAKARGATAYDRYVIDRVLRQFGKKRTAECGGWSVRCVHGWILQSQL